MRRTDRRIVVLHRLLVAWGATLAACGGDPAQLEADDIGHAEQAYKTHQDALPAGPNGEEQSYIYALTSFGGGPHNGCGDDPAYYGTMPSCSWFKYKFPPTDGKWWYATGAFTFGKYGDKFGGCGRRLRLETTLPSGEKRCGVVAVATNGPHQSMIDQVQHCGGHPNFRPYKEEGFKFSGMLLDVSPAATQYLRGSSCPGRPKCHLVKVTPLEFIVPKGPEGYEPRTFERCYADGTKGGDCRDETHQVLKMEDSEGLAEGYVGPIDCETGDPVGSSYQGYIGATVAEHAETAVADKVASSVWIGDSCQITDANPNPCQWVSGEGETVWIGDCLTFDGAVPAKGETGFCTSSCHSRTSCHDMFRTPSGTDYAYFRPKKKGAGHKRIRPMTSCHNTAGPQNLCLRTCTGADDDGCPAGWTCAPAGKVAHAGANASRRVCTPKDVAETIRRTGRSVGKISGAEIQPEIFGCAASGPPEGGALGWVLIALTAVPLTRRRRA